ncbi:MAG: hypothetical protein RR365_14175 [Bacteroides sp.]
MQLEDCTKKELIYFIRNSGFFSHKDLEREVQSCRSYAALKKQRDADEAGSHALGRYIELLAQVDGKRIADVPLDILREMDAAHKAVAAMALSVADFKHEKSTRLKGAVDHEVN